ncbi:MAG: penicillin-binding protein 2, partial [Acidobacteriota bacterium]
MRPTGPTPLQAPPAGPPSVWQRPRLVVLCALCALWFGAVAFRLWQLQIERHDHYAAKAEEQQQRVVVLDPPRGTIFDSRGRELAVSVEVASIAAYPHRIDDPEATADALIGALDDALSVDRSTLVGRLASDRRFVWVERKVDQPRADAVRALDLAGLDFLPEAKRYYPMRQLAGAVLGYVGTDNEGLAGLEFHYDDEVSTEKGQRTVLIDGRAGTAMAPDLDHDDARPGADLHLTLDAALQNIVEKELARAVETSGAEQGMALMMDPSTGAVLAMASFPGFDPNQFADFPRSTWRNAPVMDAYEPGSTFKMVTLAAALEANAVDSLTSFYCGNGRIVLGRTTIHDHKAFADLSVRQIIAKSSNVGAIHLGDAAGRELFYATIESFGFGQPTGIDLPSESAGLLRPLDRWSPITPAYVSFGQGVSITTLQLTNAFAAIANGGRLLRPHIVRRVGDRDIAPEPELVQLPVAPSTVRATRSMLESVVVDGTALDAALDGYRVAGKTGTAQKAGHGGYLPNRYIASFVGFAPVSDPAIVLTVVIDEPWPRYHGGEVAAPAWARMASQTLLYLGVPPDLDLPERRWPRHPEYAEPPVDGIRLARGTPPTARR